MRERAGSRRSCVCTVPLLLLLVAPFVAPCASTLTLGEAFRRVSEAHPDLARFTHLIEAVDAEAAVAAQRPALDLEADVENALGTGAHSGAGSAEITLSIASVLELGDKLAARSAVARARRSALDQRLEANWLDLMAEVARRFLDVLASQALERIARDDVGQRERTVEAATRRVEAGAEPVSARLAAEAAASRARLQLVRAQGQGEIAARRLAILWGERKPAFKNVAGDPLIIPTVPALESLLEMLDRSPELKRFADETRLREARLQLAKSERSPDLNWQFGLRRLEATNDWATVMGVSMPIGSRTRGEPSIRATQAELSALELEREGDEIALHATLVDAYGRMRAASIEANLGRDEVLPRLVQAESAAERAYRAGALSYLEWAQIQADVTTTRREQLQAAIAAHRALIEIQRLTGDPFLAGAGHSS